MSATLPAQSVLEKLDFDDDGVIDITDLGDFSSALTGGDQSVISDLDYDLNGDGVVDFDDLVWMDAHLEDLNQKYQSGSDGDGDGEPALAVTGCSVTQQDSMATFEMTVRNDGATGNAQVTWAFAGESVQSQVRTVESGSETTFTETASIAHLDPGDYPVTHGAGVVAHKTLLSLGE